MAIIALTTAAGAPGCTTTALGLALTAAGPTLLVEADPAGSALSSGWFRGTPDPAHGLLNLALDTGEPVAAGVLRESVLVDEGAERRILLGLADPAQAATIEPWWSQIGAALHELDTAGYTVIVDLGRAHHRHAPTLLDHADLVLVVCRATLSSAVRSHPLVAEIDAGLSARGLSDRLGLAVIGQADYSPTEVARALGAPLALRIPEDARTARVLSDGARLGTRAAERKFESSALMRSYRDGSRDLAARIAQGQAVLARSGAAVGGGQR